MSDVLQTLGTGLMQHWHVWMLSVVLVVAAVIDGVYLKVPNWITFPLIISGWIYSSIVFGLADDYTWYQGLGYSMLGTMVGLGLLLPFYAIGGMGAGDVKLLAGVGAWVLSSVTFYAFCVSVIVGAVIAIAMVVYRRAWKKHSSQFRTILTEIMVLRNVEKIAEIAAQRKSSMLLLPYGIPIAIGSILYFAWMGMLL